MALCDQGYLCDVCGQEVETIDGSDLYLRYVLGEVVPETLHSTPERHLRCNPTLAQFIVADGFEPVVVAGYFGKAALDPAFVAAEEARFTAGRPRRLPSAPTRPRRHDAATPLPRRRPGPGRGLPGPVPRRGLGANRP